MRIAIVAMLALHGLAHLVGFLTPWGLVPSPREGAPALNPNVILGGRVTLDRSARWLAFLWLAGAAGFALAAFGLALGEPWAIAGLLGATLVSTVLTAVWMPAARIGLYLNLAILAGLLLAGALAFRTDMKEAYARVASPTGAVVTPFGPVEYADTGTGSPMLVVHGTGGGFDQGMMAAGGLVAHGFRLIAPSRYGYLGTPTHPQASPALEADLFAALLDSLGIRVVSVISYSAGTAPAVQFALRHPERVSHLILVVPAAGGMVPVTHPNPPPQFMMDVALKNNLPMWLTRKLAPNVVYRLAAVPPSLVRTMSRAEREELENGISTLFPVSLRYDGTSYDARTQSGSEPLYPLESVRAPVLLVSARDDLYNTLPNAEAIARRIPHAEVFAVETGGHLLVGRGEEVSARIAGFARR